MPTRDTFVPVVRSCVEKGRQYQISFGGNNLISQKELQDPTASFAYRLMGCLTEGKGKYIPFEGAPKLNDLLMRLAKGKKTSLIIVNFDETNMLLKTKEEGMQYLLRVLAGILAFNKRQGGFIFCIMSGTNVRDLHNVLKTASSGNAPLEIPLPLLGIGHMTEIVENTQMIVLLIDKSAIQ